jgi:hypothetical protein
MSLTSFLDNNTDVRERFKQEFSKQPLKVKNDLLAPPLTKRYTTVGTAFDYLLRFYVKYLNPNTIDKGYWVAEIALALLQNNPALYAKGKKVISQAKEREKDFLESGQITDGLIESTLSLAYLDPIYRANRGHEYIGIPIDENDIEDVRKLISIVTPDHFKAKRLCMINPTFGIASTMVGGADADIVIDDNIVDIKTSQKFELQLSDFHQVIGYYVLHQIGGLGELQPKPEIKRVSIYFSRYAYLHTVDLEDMINEDTFLDFVEWFKERAKKEYGETPAKKVILVRRP